MSGYHGRRGPNVSRLIADLNNPNITSTFDPLAEPSNLEQDLALFTDNEFIDWNAGTDFDPNAPLDLTNFELDQKNTGTTSTVNTGTNSTANESNMNFGKSIFTCHG